MWKGGASGEAGERKAAKEKKPDEREGESAVNNSNLTEFEKAMEDALLEVGTGSVVSAPVNATDGSFKVGGKHSPCINMAASHYGFKGRSATNTGGLTDPAASSGQSSGPPRSGFSRRRGRGNGGLDAVPAGGSTGTGRGAGGGSFMTDGGGSQNSGAVEGSFPILGGRLTQGTSGAPAIS